VKLLIPIETVSSAVSNAILIRHILILNLKFYYSMGLATNISDFLRRWHISLSTWFKDYLYIPLGGNRVSPLKNYFNVFITFLVSGIWHGANWTFVIWGSLHGVYNALQKLLGIDQIRFSRFSGFKLVMIFINFILVTLAWVFFRANTTADGFSIIGKIFTNHGAPFVDPPTLLFGVFGLSILLLKEISEEFFPNTNLFFESKKPLVSALAAALVVIIILSIGVFDGGQFIYFQF
jgi:D-alanyl-lipoteichoic acid acyltransferase DltB (MBOAT superfamily)